MGLENLKTEGKSSTLETRKVGLHSCSASYTYVRTDNVSIGDFRQTLHLQTMIHETRIERTFHCNIKLWELCLYIYITREGTELHSKDRKFDFETKDL